MTRLGPILVVGFLGIFSIVASADAQILPFFRRPGGDDDSVTPLPRGNNPETERQKNEADRANQGGEFQKAIDLTNGVLAKDPRDSVAYYLRGSARVELGVQKGDGKLMREGVADAREAIRYDTQRTSMYYLPYLHGMKNLAILENRRDHAETAVKIATQVLGIPGLSNEDKANILFQRAQANAWLNNTDAAVADLEEGLRVFPSHFGARASVADVLAKAGRNEQALAAFNKLVESFPENPLSYNNRGMFEQSLSKHQDAVADFTRAIERDPNYFYALTNRGFTFLQMDNANAAEADFTQSLKINPQQPFVYNFRGLAKLSRGDAAGAIQDQKTLVDMNPKDLIALGDLGFLHFFTDDFAAALQEFEAAQAIDPKAAHFNPWKIAAQQRLGKAENLKTTYKASLAKDLKDRDWTDHLIAYLLGAEPEGELFATASKAKDQLKNDEACEADYFIGQSRVAAGKSKEAVEFFQRALGTKSRNLAAYRGSQFALKKLNATASAASSGVPVQPAGK